MEKTINLKGITWNHSRGLLPMVATAQRFSELHPNVNISWEKRSLQQFADFSIQELAERFDLLVIDHPWAGFAAKTKSIVPLDLYLSPEYLKDQEENSVGQSYESYFYDDHLWALPIDAATPVAVSRPDLLAEKGLQLPQSFDDLLELADKGLVAFAGIPIDVLMNFYTLCCSLGEDPCQNDEEVVSTETGVKVLKMYRELASKMDKANFNRNPIQVYEAMTLNDEIAYCPFAYGYSNYSRNGYARKTLHFHDMISLDGKTNLRSTLGGTGLAISAKCEALEMAAKYVTFVGSPACQSTLFFESGGQPGHLAAWKNEEVNRQSHNYFLNTLPALQRAFLRPRYHGSMYFQDHAGDVVRDYLMNGGDEIQVLTAMNELYLQSKKFSIIMNKPLEGLLVLEFCQFLAGPSAGLKLADLGARVIKIERPKTGDACRQLSIKNLFIDEDSLLFHTINRNKESYAADLKNPEDLERLKKLISKADVMTHNFRPGVMEKIGLDYETVRKMNPKIVYGMVTGYGNEGPWKNKPGQDLLVQSVSGLTFLSGVDVDGPVPFGLSVSDIMCGNHLAQGIMAALIKRAKTNKSVLVEVSLLESILDVQFEVLTTYLNDGGKLPDRSGAKGSAHAYLSAPYGMYETSDGYIAMAMGNLPNICAIINCDIADLYVEAGSAFENRDKLIVRLAATFKKENTKHWVDLLESHGIWCAEVLNYQTATAMNTYKSLQIEQELDLADGKTIKTTVSPIRLDNEKLFASKAAPKLGENTSEINKEFELK